MQTLHPGFPERVLMQVSEQEVGHFTETAKEDQVAGKCFRRIGSALRPQCCPHCLGEDRHTYLLIWRASRSSLAPAALAVLALRCLLSW